MAKTNLRLVTPDSELRTVILRRRSNRDMGRDREHLTELEVERLIKVAKGNRHGHRDATIDPDRLPARPESVGALRPTMVVDRVRDRYDACALGKGRSGSHASALGR